MDEEYPENLYIDTLDYITKRPFISKLEDLYGHILDTWPESEYDYPLFDIDEWNRTEREPVKVTDRKTGKVRWVVI